jgi:hypothetical protein
VEELSEAGRKTDLAERPRLDGEVLSDAEKHKNADAMRKRIGGLRDVERTKEKVRSTEGCRE